MFFHVKFKLIHVLEDFLYYVKILPKVNAKLLTLHKNYCISTNVNALKFFKYVKTTIYGDFKYVKNKIWHKICLFERKKINK